MDAPIQVQVFAHDGVVLARPPSPVTTAGSRYLAGAGAGLNNGLDMITGLHLDPPAPGGGHRQQWRLCGQVAAAAEPERPQDPE